MSHVVETVGKILVLVLYGFLAVAWSFDSYISTGERLLFMTVSVIIPLAVYLLTRRASIRDGASGRVRLVWPLAIGIAVFFDTLVPVTFFFLIFGLIDERRFDLTASYPFVAWGVSFAIAALTTWLLVRKLKW